MTLPVVKGTYHSDSSISASVASLIEGFSGSDHITGSSGADQIYGGHTQWEDYGLDEKYVGPTFMLVGDNDVIDAGAGNDIIYVGTGNDNITGGAGIDQLDFHTDGGGQFEKDTLPPNQDGKRQWVSTFGTLTNVDVDLLSGSYAGIYEDSSHKVVGHNSGTFTGIEAVLGTGGDDNMRGSNHNDQFKPYGGTDVIDGRGGFDILSYNDAGTHGITVTWSSGIAIDTYGHSDHFSNIEEIVGSRFADTFNGTTGSQVFVGGDGADIFNGAAGVDTVDYHLETGAAGINIVLGNGTGKDTYGKIDHFDGIEDIKASAHADVITGDITNNTFWGYDANDNIGGLAGNDTLWGGNGNDFLSGGDNNDTLYGEADNDNLNGGTGDDTMSGGDGNDALRGAAGNDLIHGDDGNDNIDGQTGDDLIYGDAGNDTINDVSYVADDLFYERNGNTLSGGDGDDSLYGAGFLSGGNGNDKVRGEGVLHGNDGNDTLEAVRVNTAGPFPLIHLLGDAGNDTLNSGGDEAVIADYSYAATPIIAVMESGKVTVSATDVDTIIDIREIEGSAYADKITGTAASETFYGGAGNDSINGSGGNDNIDGGDGADTLHGGAGFDNIWGRGGNNTLYSDGGGGNMSGEDGNDKIYVNGDVGTGETMTVESGAGADIITIDGKGDMKLSGGTGADHFVFDDAFFASGGIKAEITDFSAASLDRIDLSQHYVHLTVSSLGAHDDGHGNVIIGLIGGATIWIDHVTAAQLVPSDFIF